MTDTTTLNKGLSLQTVGGNDNEWGAILNDTLQLIDSALGGTLDRDIAGDTMLTTTEIENTGYHFRGTLTDSPTIIFPTYFGLAVVRNSVTQPISIGIAGGRFVTVVPNGCTAIWSDGTDFTDVNQFLTFSGVLRGIDAKIGSGEDGSSLDITAGTGDGSGTGGAVYLSGGASGNVGLGGAVYLSGGLGTTSGGDIHLEGGAARSTGGNGGQIWITAGTASGTGFISGDVNITAFKVNDGATPGNVRISLGGGGLFVTGLSTSDPGIAGRVWLDHGVLIQSGSKLSTAASGNFLSSSGGTVSGTGTVPTLTVTQPVTTTPIALFDFGTGTPPALMAGASALQLVSADATTNSVRLLIDTFSAPNFGQGVARFTGRRARGTRAAPTALANGDIIVSHDTVGHDGTGYFNAGEFRLVTGTTWSATDHSSYWDTIANNVITARSVRRDFGTGQVSWGNNLPTAEFMRLQPSGNLSLGSTTDAGYKLDVNGSGRFVVDGTTKWLTITSNTATVPPPVLPNDTQLQFIGGDGLCSRTEYITYGDMGILTFRKANGTGAAPTATTGNMFALIGQGYDGSGWTTSQRSAFYCIAQGTWTPTSTPTFLSWWTTPVSSTTAAEFMRLQPSGNLSIGNTTDAGYKLDVTGTARASGDLTAGGNFYLTSTGPNIQTPNGTAGVASKPLNIQTGSGNGANTGTLSLQTGTTNGAIGGDINIISGSSSGASGHGGGVYLNSGSGFGTSSLGGNITLATGNGSSVANNGKILLSADNGSTNAVTVATTGITMAIATTHTGSFATTLPAAKAGTAYSVGANDTSLMLAPTGTMTLTLPAAATNGGRILWLNLIAAFAVNSPTANVVPLAGGAATTAIIPAGAGKFCMLQSDGTNWQIMMAN